MGSRTIEKELSEAIDTKNLSMLQHLLTNIEAKGLPITSSLLAKAKAMMQTLQHANSLLKDAIKAKQIEALRVAIQACAGLGFSNPELANAVQLRNQLESIYKEAALALNIMDTQRMQTVMKLSRELGLKNTDELNDIHHILFEMEELEVKTIQLEKAVELADDYLIVERRIALIDERIKSTFFRSDWKIYPRLKDPKVWASSLFLSGNRHHTFFQYTRHIIHESMSTLASAIFNKTAVKCFKSLLTVTGDRIAGPPLYEAFFLVNTALKVPQLHEELYLQVMKQLTNNPDPTSRTKGWNIFALFLRTFPPGNLEEFIHAFIRKNCDESQMLLRLMYYSMDRYPFEITQDYVDRNLKLLVNDNWEVPIVPIAYSIECHPYLTEYRPKYKKQSTLSFI